MISAFARQVLGKRLADLAAAFKGWNLHNLRRHAFRGDLVLGGVGLKFFELQFHLVDQPGASFRTLTILLAT